MIDELTGKKRGRGRPPAEPEDPGVAVVPLDDRLVAMLARFMCSLEEIAEVFGCSTDALKARYGPAIERGRAAAKRKLRKLQFQKAEHEASDPRARATMLVWLGKQWLGQTDQVVVDDRTHAAAAHAEAIRRAREERKEALRIAELALKQGADGDSPDIAN